MGAKSPQNVKRRERPSTPRRCVGSNQLRPENTVAFAESAMFKDHRYCIFEGRISFEEYREIERTEF